MQGNSVHEVASPSFVETSKYDPRTNLPSNGWEHRFTDEHVQEFIKENREIQALKGKNLWRGIAYVYASRLLRHVRTCSKKELSSINTRNLTTSAAIAYDKGFPKEDQANTGPAVQVYNNLFLGSDVGKKVHESLNKALPQAQAELRRSTEVESTKVILKD